MFLKWINKMVAAPLSSALFALALAVIGGQLYAMGTLAQGQVQKAQLRDSQQLSANIAMASCVQSSRGAALNSCRLASNPAMQP